MYLKVLAAASVAAFTVTTSAQTAPVRPEITGISHLAIYASDPAATDQYYREVIGAARLPDPENPQGMRYAFNDTQFIEVLPLPQGAGINRIDHTAYNTDNAEGMRKYLAAHSWKTPAKVENGADGSQWFTVLDPEGNKVQFVQLFPSTAQLTAPRDPNQHVVKVSSSEMGAMMLPPQGFGAIGHHIIHFGFLVHNRAVEDTFYRDLLGFRPYWFGGMVEGKLDWVSQQTPNGHDWLEYMLVSDPQGQGIPTDITQHQLGVLDHFSIGVTSVDAAFKTLSAGSRLTGVHDAHTQIGKDGKGQFNLYDPDGVRVELMNFHATQKPCCSPFTAEDPAE
ncbi:MAG: VOC family protein [Terracidiphilus sp.]|jgi:catechol 2,3-dioxygenase-like lactoylglutathione lyase family enzyme